MSLNDSLSQCLNVPMSQYLNVSIFQCLNVRSAAAAVDSLGSAVDGAAHALVKRSPLVHAKAKKKSRVSHGPPHMKRKCPRGHRYNKKTRKCQKQKKGPNTETGIRGLNK